MNELTKQFFQADFPGWTPRKDFDTVWNEFWVTKEIPVLELDLGIDPSGILAWLQQNTDRFTEAKNIVLHSKQAETLGQSWFRRPHSQGRNDLPLFGKYPQLRKLLDNTPARDIDPEYSDMAGLAPLDLKSQLEQCGFNLVHGMKAAVLETGGHLEPHKDAIMIAETMTHLWIPLHESQANLKIWPSGLLHHRVGCVYLLNNQSFMHSIANFDAQSRYVITARIDHKKISADLNNKIRTALKQQWFED